ncbi:hypothetical protein CO180_03775 [candidate division WWE3 bacterium CG_4_9_14_3_um_filter_41_6]|uniref:Uncharacterized protein n=1 Tax=candidate division WWE3 bacterium CG_4_10_14_0_2_um_filter_41_14 TaxID=1975072 RepID=A0A2M7TG12_UNCKA|nr:MAG: hypothetical protein COY32_05825 [candidate division WWE3 bacterium CG_4_10_14_0_2_um_filter_41_14]PJA38333.1 MAG: hypothetical protein CO180_03775 [candidate division WWE3 bacterium CG_4_9_14_3_um_filter_41_6]
MLESVRHIVPVISAHPFASLILFWVTGCALTGTYICISAETSRIRNEAMGTIVFLGGSFLIGLIFLEYL